MADRRAELERKKQKLAEMRALKEQRNKAQGLQPAVKVEYGLVLCAN